MNLDAANSDCYKGFSLAGDLRDLLLNWHFSSLPTKLHPCSWQIISISKIIFQTLNVFLALAFFANQVFRSFSIIWKFVFFLFPILCCFQICIQIPYKSDIIEISCDVCDFTQPIDSLPISTSRYLPPFSSGHQIFIGSSYSVFLFLYICSSNNMTYYFSKGRLFMRDKGIRVQLVVTGTTQLWWRFAIDNPQHCAQKFIPPLVQNWQCWPAMAISESMKCKSPKQNHQIPLYRPSKSLPLQILSRFSSVKVCSL